MAEHPDERAGWELIWRSGDQFTPPRYRSSAPPNDTVVEWADTLPAGGFVLDVGCGVGRHMVYLGGRGFRVAGVDIAPTGIQLSRQACETYGIPFEGHVADMNALPWPDNTFDAAFSTSTMNHHLRAGIEATLAEIRRVLQPGGLLLIDMPSTDTPNYQSNREKVAAGELTEPEPNTFVDVRPNRPDDEDEFLPHHFSDEADMRDLLRPFKIIKLGPDMKDARRGMWVAWAQKPL